MAKCRGCGKEIIWIKTATGKAMPCDPEPVAYWQTAGGKRRIVTPNGEVIACELDGSPDRATGIGYIPHWATCPAAGRFHKGGSHGMRP